MQLIETTTMTTTMLVKDFDDKVFENQGSVASVAYSEQLSFIVSCSAEGGLVVWSTVNTFNPMFMYSTTKSSQACKKVLIYKYQYAVVQYTSEIDIFDILNP